MIVHWSAVHTSSVCVELTYATAPALPSSQAIELQSRPLHSQRRGGELVIATVPWSAFVHMGSPEGVEAMNAAE
jgi:hypothetical protein